MQTPESTPNQAGGPRLVARMSYAILWLVIVCYALLSEIDVLPTAYVKPDAQLLYALQILCVALTLLSTWGALRLPVMKTVRHACELHPERHYIYSILRMCWLGTAVLIDLIVYYALTADSWSLYCLLIGLVGLVFCYPSAPEPPAKDEGNPRA